MVGMGFCSLWLLSICLSSVVCEVQDARDKCFSDMLVDAGDILYVGRDYVHTGVILAHVAGKSAKEADVEVVFEKQDGKTVVLKTFTTMLESILEYSVGTPIHFIIITDQDSLRIIMDCMKNVIGKYISESVILNHGWNSQIRKTLPVRLRVEFVDLKSFTHGHREIIDALKSDFGHHFPEGTKFVKQDGSDQVIVPTQKYTLDLFYIAPFYHRRFPRELEKILVIDADLEFKIDLIEVYSEFNRMDERAVIGVGFDLSPHYHRLLRSYREEVDRNSDAGEPGNQGFNTGIVLYDLAKMRASGEFELEISAEKVHQLSTSFNFTGSVGDQDWMTLLGFSRPWLFHVLPCHFNVQTSIIYRTYFSELYSEEEFQRWHYCSQTKILHRNG